MGALLSHFKERELKDAFIDFENAKPNEVQFLFFFFFFTDRISLSLGTLCFFLSSLLHTLTVDLSLSSSSSSLLSLSLFFFSLSQGDELGLALQAILDRSSSIIARISEYKGCGGYSLSLQLFPLSLILSLSYLSLALHHCLSISISPYDMHAFA